MADIDADLEGLVSPPRDNGEIVFAAPWEQRVFALTVALCRSQVIEWEGFRQSLIRHIADAPDVPYWQTWADALEDALAGTVSRTELAARRHELLTRPAGHDHR
jgi:hypothetical protein